MDFEERIDKLTERHEALTQTVEMLAHDVMKQRENINLVLTAISRLREIAEIQDRRIERLEGGES